MQMAVDTPTMLPVPTRDAVETISAPKDEMPSLSFGFSETTRIDSPNRRIWIRPVRTVKIRPATIKNSGTMYGWYKKPLMALTTLSIASIISFSSPLLCCAAHSREQLYKHSRKEASISRLFCNKRQLASRADLRYDWAKRTHQTRSNPYVQRLYRCDH